MRGSTTPTLPGGPSRPPWTPSGQRFAVAPTTRSLRAPWTMSKGLSRPLHPRPGGLRAPGPRPVFRHRLRPKRRCRLSLWKPIDPGAGRKSAGHAARGTREEGWRADRLRCTAWLGRSAHHRSLTARPRPCGTSSLRACATQASRSTASSRARSSVAALHVHDQSPRWTARGRQRFWRRRLRLPIGLRPFLRARRSAMKSCRLAAKSFC